MASEQEHGQDDWNEHLRAWEAAYEKTFKGQAEELQRAVHALFAVVWQAAVADWCAVTGWFRRDKGDTDDGK